MTDTQCPLITRRQFLSRLGATAAVSVGGYAVAIWGRNPALASAAVGSLGPAPSGRTLVVVEMGGGNDALSMIVPHGDSRYFDLRGELAIADAIDLDGEIGLNPALGYVSSRWAQGDLAVVEGVGYPDPDLSHFASMATWWSARPGGLGAGWLGRYLDGTVGTEDPLAGIVVGPGPSPALSGDDSFVVSIQDETGLRPSLPPWIDDADELMGLWSAFAPSPVDSPELFGKVADAIAATVASADRLDDVLDAGPGPSRSGRRSFASDMELAAKIATSPISPRVLMVHGFGDFDTHEGQAGRYAALMAELDEGISAFFGEVDRAGAAQQIVLMTTSEFGRRVAFNGSGTDHGTAAAHLVIGAPVSGGKFGESPDLGALDGTGNLVHTVDLRSYYASILEGWLGVGHEDVLAGTFETLPLIGGADPPSSGAGTGRLSRL